MSTNGPQLEERLSNLERRVASMERWVFDGAPAEAPHVPPREERARRRRIRAHDAPRRRTVASPMFEEDAIGTWFPRLGALAVLIGAGFGFKYAIDQGWIGPGLRVVLGIVAGLALVAGSEVTRKRGWHPYAQAVAGCGVALVYLSVWAAFHLYGLVSGPVAFVGLVATTGSAVALALRLDSLPLALIGIAASFLNPIVVGSIGIGGTTVLVYVVALDLGVLTLAAARRWAALDALAFFGSWTLYGASSAGVGSFAFATTLFVTFAAVPFVRRALHTEVRPWRDVRLAVGGGLAYYLAFMSEVFDAHQHGTVTLSIAAVYAGLTLLSLRMSSKRDLLTVTHAGISLLFVTIWPVVALESRETVVFWALEAVLLCASARAAGMRQAHLAGGIVMMLSVAANIVRIGDGYHPHDLLVNAESLVLVVQIAALYGIAALLRDQDEDRTLVNAALGGAHLLTLLWLSVEARAHIGGDALSSQEQQAVAFAYTSIWSLYAGGLLAAGIALRSRLLRALSVWIFGCALVKLTVRDLWFLDAPERVLGFIGIGALLLACSLMFHRFKDFVLGPEGL
jgi:uncharacterized membrane protein